MFTLAIDQHFHDREHWLMTLSHQVNLFLAPLRQDFNKASVSFICDDAVFTCKVRITRQARPLLKICASHSDGVVAIGQAMARSRRTLARDAQNTTSGNCGWVNRKEPL